MHDNRGFLYQAVFDLFIYILSTVECVLMYCILGEIGCTMFSHSATSKRWQDCDSGVF